MLVSSDWTRVPAVIIGGSTISMMIILAMYGNSLMEYENSLKGGGSEAPMLTTEMLTESPTTPALPDEYYLIVGENRILKSECRKFVMVMAKRMLKTFNGCIKDLKKHYTTKESMSSHFSCAVKCFMTKMDWFVPGTEQITLKSFYTFVENHIPVRYHIVGHVLAGKCLEEHIPKIDPNDEYCTEYGEMVKCLQAEVDSKCSAPPAKT